MFQVADPGFPTTAAGTINNPVTGGPNCPMGFGTGEHIGRIFTEGGIGAWQFVCQATASQTTSLTREFGGTFQVDDCGQRTVANPLTGILDCPSGYQKGQYGRAMSPEGSHCGVTQFVCFR
jgi:hypothetical protein